MVVAPYLAVSIASVAEVLAGTFEAVAFEVALALEQQVDTFEAVVAFEAVVGRRLKVVASFLIVFKEIL